MSFQSEFIRTSAGPALYYTEYTTTNLYVLKSFGSSIHTITVANDGASDNIQVSFDGATLEGDVKYGETFSLNVAGKTGIYVKGTAGGQSIRIWGW